jgi:hypothetical protein
MTGEQRIGPEGRDDDLTRALRRLYAAPDGAGYWERLEERILARVAAGDGGSLEDLWWTPLARWATPGVIAAAVALVVAGATLWQAREVREQNAARAAMLQANAPLAQFSAVAGNKPDNDAVLRYVLTP